MPVRTILLRLMLWSLGLAAATGVLAVLLQGGDLVWKLVGTGITTALACALMIPASLLVDREPVRWAGLLGMSAVIVEFLMALSLIWEIARPLLLYVTNVEIKVASTMVFLGLAAGLTMTLAPPLSIPRHSTAAKAGLGFIALALVAYLAAIWMTDYFRGHGDKGWETANALVVFGLLTVPSLFGLSAAERRRWRWAGVVSSFVACSMWVMEIWNPIGSDVGVVVFCALLSLGAATAHANLCLVAVRLTPGQQWVRGGTIAAAVVTALLVVLFVSKDKFPAAIPIVKEMVGRFTEAAGIIAACGTLALLVLARINRKVDAEPGAGDLDEVSLVCPRCRKRQSLPVGNSTCASCGLRISIRVEEPRCAKCDYLLRGLTSDRCPECGTPIGSPVAAGR
jgi:hypothetical protein